MARKPWINLIESLRQCGRDWLREVVPILERQRDNGKCDLYDPIKDEVIDGLFAREFRFVHVLVLDYHLLSWDVGQVVLRMMLESRIYLTYLTEKDDIELFREFRKYGIGQEILYKTQLQDLATKGSVAESADLLEYISSPSDDEIADELVNLKLKNFGDLRQLSEEYGLKDLYILYYQPFSVSVHGHWPELRHAYLTRCTEPLHRFHLKPTFDLPRLDFDFLRLAMSFFSRCYAIWITHHQLADELDVTIAKYLSGVGAALKEFDLQAKAGTG